MADAVEGHGRRARPSLLVEVSMWMRGGGVVVDAHAHPSGVVADVVSAMPAAETLDDP